MSRSLNIAWLVLCGAAAVYCAIIGSPFAALFGFIAGARAVMALEPR